jgi:hypothetical protein
MVLVYISADLSMAVPITNALTFVFTIVAGKVILEEDISTGKLDASNLGNQDRLGANSEKHIRPI